MRANESKYSVQTMAELFELSRSGYYAWRSRAESRRSRENRALLAEIRKVHKQVDATYGSPRMHRELVGLGHSCGLNRVQRLMAKHKIAAVHKPAFKVTTNSSHSFELAKNLLARNFEAQSPNEKWAGDITFIPTQEGWLYLAVVLDLHSRRVIGWHTAPRIDRSLVTRALEKALNTRETPPALFHSDRGAQYASDEFQRLLKQRRISCSMSRSGDCWDNAVVESFFHSLKVERVKRRRYKSRSEAHTDLFDYIERFYNRNRRHSAIGYTNPVAFEEMQKAA